MKTMPQNPLIPTLLRPPPHPHLLSLSCASIAPSVPMPSPHPTLMKKSMMKMKTMNPKRRRMMKTTATTPTCSAVTASAAAWSRAPPVRSTEGAGSVCRIPSAGAPTVKGASCRTPGTQCFTSDNAINCLEVGAAHHKGGWTLPSPKTLKKELTKNGGSMHQLCMLFSGRKLSSGSPCSCEVGAEGTKKKKSKNLAKDMKNRLAFLRRRNESPGSNPASKLDKSMKSVKVDKVLRMGHTMRNLAEMGLLKNRSAFICRPTPEEALKWGRLT
ncbi:Regulator of G-protein signaling 3 [Larimichthys crocea]|uniref:Uncharacterized protein n=1 Tax=Larimichthys crocea TaxID=215358 RepID=A0ACD3QNQ4_LARCR|nr:Regulator of G-protein signaling 3 [Larimichthys crocea]